LAPFSFLLLHLYLVFVAVPVLTLAITGFVELNIRRFSVELYVLIVELLLATSRRRNMGPYVSLFFAYHDWRFQMNVKDHEKFVITWLEEQVLDITEQYIFGSVLVGY
jgi:hypothetical protein